MPDEVSKGLEMLESTAQRFNLSVGSRFLDFARGTIRLSLEANVELGARRALRIPYVVLTREFVEDLPQQKTYQNALATYLQSLSLRLSQPDPASFLTLSGVPVNQEVHWPFREVQNADDAFVHVLVRAGIPWQYEANLSISVSGPDGFEMQLNSLNPPFAELFVVNAIRISIDKRSVEFYDSGLHPEVLQPIRLSLSLFDHKRLSDSEIENFIARKVYWLAFRQGDDTSKVPFLDPYDSLYMGVPLQRLRQLARILVAKKRIEIDDSGSHARVKDGILAEAEVYERHLSELLRHRDSREKSETAESTAPGSSKPPSVFISYSSEDSHFALGLATALRARNIGPWLDEWEIRVGDSLQKRIGEALRRNDFMVIVLSPASVRSQWVQRELAEAMNREIREKRVIVLPVIARECDIPPFLTDKKYADFSRDSAAALDSLVQSIESHHTELGWVGSRS